MIDSAGCSLRQRLGHGLGILNDDLIIVHHEEPARADLAIKRLGPRLIRFREPPELFSAEFRDELRMISLAMSPESRSEFIREHGEDEVGVEGQQFLAVELGGRLDDAVEIEPFEQERAVELR